MEGDDAFVPRRQRAQLDDRWDVARTDIRPYTARGAPFLVHPPVERRGAKSFANDLVEDHGVVITRAVFHCDLLRVSLKIYRFVHPEQARRK